MTEMQRTLAFLAVAVVLCAGAVAPQLMDRGDVRPAEQVGALIFPDFTDPLAARSLELVRVAVDEAQLRRFKVEQVGGRWTIPSHGNYPADAANQMRDAAASLLDLKSLGVATDVAKDHEKFGVIEPDETKLSAGEEGFGDLIVLQDAKGKDLLRLIVGKRVKGSENQRFVRIPGQDRVHVAEIDVAKLSTKFEDWIERDLLQLSTWDIAHIELKDYSVQANLTPQGAVQPNIERRFTMKLDCRDGWQLEDFVEYVRNRPRESQLLDDEELNAQRLGELKNALDELKIAGVARKPKGLSANLTASGELLAERESLVSLLMLGFVPIAAGSGGERIDVLAANGEVVVTMKDGVEYLLRFGNIAGAEEDDSAKLNRHLLVTTRVDMSQFPPPELTPLPPAPAEPPAAPSATESDAADADENESPAAQPPAEGPAATPAADALAAERERITKDNNRKLEDHRERVKKAEDRVRELNARFADWYYVISEDTYKKIRLSRADVIQARQVTPEESFDLETFEQLRSQGLEGAAG